jgi:hypothetical protein
MTMTEPRKLHCYAYVKAPYDRVCAVWRRQPLELLKEATTTSAAVGHKIAEAAVHSFLEDVGAQIRREVHSPEALDVRS